MGLSKTFFKGMCKSMKYIYGNFEDLQSPQQQNWDFENPGKNEETAKH